MCNFLKYSILCAFVLVAFFQVNAAEVTQRSLGWLTYTNHLKFNNSWTLTSEIHERFFFQSVEQHQNVYRMKLHYKIGENSNWDVAPGMVLFLQTTPQDPNRTSSLLVPELRPQLDLNYSQKLKHVTFQHRYRFEARFFHNISTDKKSLEDGYTFNNFRVRYQIAALIPIVKFKENKKLQLRVGDELHINLGEKVLNNYFDQNRIFGSMLVDMTPSLNLEVGYLYWYQHAANNDRIHRHFLRVGIQQTIQLKSKKK